MHDRPSQEDILAYAMGNEPDLSPEELRGFVITALVTAALCLGVVVILV